MRSELSRSRSATAHRAARWALSAGESAANVETRKSPARVRTSPPSEATTVSSPPGRLRPGAARTSKLLWARDARLVTTGPPAKAAGERGVSLRTAAMAIATVAPSEKRSDGIVCQHARQQSIQDRRGVRPPFRETGRVPRQQPCHESLGIRCHERWCAGQAFEEHAPKGEHVHGWRKSPRTARLLGGHIRRRPDDCPRRRQRRQGRRSSRDTEVDDAHIVGV